MNVKEATAAVQRADNIPELEQARDVLKRAGFHRLASTVPKHIEVLQAIAKAKKKKPAN